jgi:capsular polysaccharide transport system permease protein
MSTPPKATRFRIRKVMAPKPAPADMPFVPAAEDDGFGDLNLRPASPADEAEMAAVRAEGLTARQLRTARRVALRNGIDTGSDAEAVMLLRRRGIDPFQRSNILSLVESAAGAAPAAPDADAMRLPAAPDRVRNLPSTEVNAEAIRAGAIMDMQRDIVRRRRRNFLLLMTRLAFFVILPTILAGWYYYRLATPLYATSSAFQIQQAEPAGAAPGLGSMFSGTQFANSKDAIAVQSYLESRDAMLRLDQTHGYKAHFAQGFVDPLQRLDPGATNEDAYKLYRRNVKIAYDPTEGLIKMEVVAADPQSSETFATALLGFAEEQVDQLTQRVREDQMMDARASYDDAEAKLDAAQAQVLDLQEKLGVLDPKVETTLVMTEVGNLEAELRKKRLELDQLLDNTRPNQARVDGARGDIERLQAQIAELRASMTQGSGQDLSLAQVTGQLRIAETEMQTRQMMLGQALQQLETARIEANRQVRYLSLSVAPVAPDEPTYPRAFENTALAFLIFAGIYLMLSLTASILREQVTS